MLKFENCVFEAKGANKNAKVFSVTLEGNEDILINDCKFQGTGYSAILNKAAANVTVKHCEFECDNYYNPIEGGSAADQGNLTVEDCNFTGIPGNNFISFYRVADGSVHHIKGCKFAGATNNNIIRLSNVNNVTATFNIDDCEYKFVSGTPDEYTGFILCQDYTSRSGNPQNFSKYNVNINNLTAPEVGELVYIYEDGQGIIFGNYPATTRDGQMVLWGTAEPISGGIPENPPIPFPM